MSLEFLWWPRCSKIKTLQDLSSLYSQLPSRKASPTMFYLHSMLPLFTISLSAAKPSMKALWHIFCLPCSNPCNRSPRSCQRMPWWVWISVSSFNLTVVFIFSARKLYSSCVALAKVWSISFSIEGDCRRSSVMRWGGPWWPVCQLSHRNMRTTPWTRNIDRGDFESYPANFVSSFSIFNGIFIISFSP